MHVRVCKGSRDLSDSTIAQLETMKTHALLSGQKGVVLHVMPVNVQKEIVRQRIVKSHAKTRVVHGVCEQFQHIHH